ncbi:MAG: UDP-glucose 4-epimerase GalE [Desulfocapsaceae bacterium]|nr:UDP-glucose 4-epimerase GalE [Desulfocapsaceae bacterium]
MNILICGGAGYIGSHMAKMLAAQNHKITVFDNFSTGHRQAVKWGELTEGDLLDQNALDQLFSKQNFDAVMHFSAKSLVGESMANPALYYRNNVIGTLNLLDAMVKYEVKKFVFSSSASTFGNPLKDFIDETHPQNPINPYGQTKLMVERILKDYAQAYGLNSVSLRYFNAAGADSEAEIGEAHNPETHLIPNVLKAVLKGGKRLKVFGKDYATADGTCVRDYIHINDLCTAHLQTLDYMGTKHGAHGFNLGNGKGFSILEIIEAAQKVVGCEIPFDYEERRPGDPATLVADSTLIHKELGWQADYTELEEILATAWKWHQAQKW